MVRFGMHGSWPRQGGSPVRWTERLSKPYRHLRSMLHRKPVLGRRRYIPETMGIEDFFRSLDDRKVSYSVLRWFEELPRLEPGEDIDMLFEDADLDLTRDLFSPEGGVPCDVYSVNGSAGSSHHGMPYYPPGAAGALLSRTVKIRGLYRAPCPEDHFLSLAYHAIYHKGLRSGLPTTENGLIPMPNPEHDYARALGDLAEALGLTLSIDMETLDDYLGQHGWHPTPQILHRLIERNPWLAQRVSSPLEIVANSQSFPAV